MKTLLLCLICWLSVQAASPYTTVTDASTLEILNPTLSERKTAKVRLANGLSVYLVSDPHLKQSAAALAVGVGSWNDPKEYPGMAHFLEHMLFMGNAAYPKEFEYMQYVNEGGGKVNAYTASDRTVYMFSINNELFEGAIDRFSHFFIDPLFLPSCINRELLAVDQEHAKNIENDGWRQYMVFKKLAHKSHPCSQFSTGNADTLKGIPQEAMQQWYRENYSADNMYLVIYSALPVDELIELATTKFSPVPTNQGAPASYPTPMIRQKCKGKRIDIKPIKEIKLLSMAWELPEHLSKDRETMGGQLLAYILQRGGKNSLLGALKRDQLAEDVRASEERFSASNTLFSLDIQLTEKGLSEIDTVIRCCFETIARLKKTGIPRYIFDEVQTIRTVAYTYQSREDAFDYVSKAAHRLVDEALDTFPQKSLIPSRYDPELYTQYIDLLTPSNCLFFVLANPQLTGIALDKQETWMGAEYAIQTFDPKLLTAWTSTSINPRIGLPFPNPYIPKNLELVHQESGLEPTTPPALVTSSDKGVIYYSSDTCYLVPQTAYLFQIRSPCIDGSTRAKVLADLYIKWLKDSLLPTTQAAEAAGSHVRISQSKFSLRIAACGYSEPSMRLCENIFKALREVKPSQKQFTLFKQTLVAHYENSAKELPVIQAVEIAQNVLFNDSPTHQEKLEALKKISYDEFAIFASQLLRKAHIEGLLHGNLTKAEAERFSESLLSILQSEAHRPSDHHRRELLLLPETRGPFKIATTTPMQGNGALLIVQQGPYSLERWAAQEVLANVLKNEFFETLRTKQQTAYIAKAWNAEEEEQLLQLFAVQSSTHRPDDLVARFELFLENFVKHYTTHLSPERFETIRTMAIASLRKPPENLRLSAERLFSLAFDHGGDFQRIDKQIAALEALTYEQTQRAATAYLSRLNTRRLAILCEGSTKGAFRYETTSKNELRTSGTFVTKQCHGVTPMFNKQTL